MTNDFTSAIISAARLYKTLNVFKPTADRGNIYPSVVRVSKPVAVAAYQWSVSDARTGDLVAIKGGFFSAEDAAESCAEWLSSQGYAFR